MDTFLIDIPMPSMGATVSELTVIDIIVQPGAQVSKGQKLAELESDKSVFEFESPCAGIVREIFGRAGDIMPSGAPFLRMETDDETLKHLQATGNPSAPAPAPKTIPAAAKPATPPPPAPAKSAPTATAVQWTPRAIKLVQEAGLNHAAITDITPTGPGGRVSGDDVTAWLAKRTIPAAAKPADETVCIAGVGYAFPKVVRTNTDILKEFPDMTEEAVLKLTGIRERRYAGEGESATSLAATAVLHALAQAKMDVSQIDGVIMATLIPDQPVPSMASALARQLGIPHALAFDLNAACAGWLYALEVGRAFIRAGTAKKLIVVTAELLSRITNPKDHATAFLFGDGAGAAILTSAAGGHRLAPMALSGDANQFEAIQRPGGGARQPFPDKSGEDHHDFYLQMNGGVVFKHAVIAFADQIESTLKRHNLKAEDIAWIVPHQANERILRAVSKRVGIPYEKFVVTIGKYGNTSAASISMALGWAAEEEIFVTGDKIIFCSVGAGLTFASGLLVW
ncbi:3-oxoacyl-(acyl-carrier-protein) synthase III [Ereboglobus sp. PH5-10]|uniref:beta-ketoacyl-ACP synthase 3 n=1 Tax=Ereboglobus sp. PH5-10 TaxID=2940629 RepID=UPI002405A96F|nr:beta-ketoacyl-ACP synthase 3 [Ereboglobus sp. PH5-10]MDF9828418.1 3-oxoacyl-(acyl-carrier-protein) synthase III [Ereboglobus sp. PH5-10]